MQLPPAAAAHARTRAPTHAHAHLPQKMPCIVVFLTSSRLAGTCSDTRTVPACQRVSSSHNACSTSRSQQQPASVCAPARLWDVAGSKADHQVLAAPGRDLERLGQGGAAHRVKHDVHA